MAAADRNGVLTLDNRHPAATGSLRPARIAATRFLADGGVGPEPIERAALIVGELTANAVRASAGRDYRLVVSIDVPRGALTIRVENPSATESPPPRAAWGPQHLLARQGRGRAIVAALADRVTVVRSGSTVEVSAEIHLPHSLDR